MDTAKTAVIQAIGAAVCYGISMPVSKKLLVHLSPLQLAALLYLGAGIGMFFVGRLRRRRAKEAGITRRELPFTAGMIVLDIFAPILLMIGLSMSSAASASLINNFEIVATTVIAFVIFKEAIGSRMFIAIILITSASIILTVDDFGSLSFSMGSIFVLLACICWGFENNCTRALSSKDPLQIVVIKGICSGLASLMIALVFSEFFWNIKDIVIALLLGFVAYGMSIFLYIRAQRHLGAARTSAFYAFAPFVGVALSFAVFDESMTLSFGFALVLMILGAYFAAFERHVHTHTHEAFVHEHRHNHNDGHHDHAHDFAVEGEHNHPHVHKKISHKHAHTPDLHHRHSHED